MYPTKTAIVVTTCLAALAWPLAAQQGGGPGPRPGQAAPPRPLPPGVAQVKHVVFGKVGDRELRLNIERPDPQPAGLLPVVIFIHGGAFRAGTYDTPTNYPLAAQGFFCVNIEYRLSGEAIWPAQIHDCKAAVRWIRAKAAQYQLDPNRIGVWGSSAGGHLAAMVGTTGNVPELEGESGNPGHSSAVTCVVDQFGPTDFMQMIGAPGAFDHGAANSPEAMLLGGRPLAEIPELVKAANPLTYLDPSDPPVLLQHGSNDRTVPVGQSDLFVAALQAAGVTHEYNRVADADHGFGGAPPEVRQQISRQVLQWFNRWLRAEPATAPAG
ncbi:MAG: alpha/beta hydrolase [Fimbriimonadaceae bacterium]|nr:alpha/beta hydrolase [Fimbriimonadaceae bacterium]